MIQINKEKRSKYTKRERDAMADQNDIDQYRKKKQRYKERATRNKWKIKMIQIYIEKEAKIKR